MPPKKGKRRKKKPRMTTWNVFLYSTMLALITGLTFASVQFLGERFGVFPVITLGELGWGESGDPIIIFVVVFIGTIFLGSLFGLLLIRKNMK